MNNTVALNPFLEHCQKRIHAYLKKQLSSPSQAPQRLHRAMHYAVLGAGKRLRPLLVYATGAAFETPLEKLDAPAAAIELIHCYSLIHDDLPVP